MKGIAHFVSGVAIATLFPHVVENAAAGSVLPVLGGVAALLPDLFDFRFTRYFEVYDLEIDPGPDPDPREIAQRLADAMRKAYEREAWQNVMLHTIRLGPDRWLQYTIRFDSGRNEVAVRVGPIVDTGQRPLPGSTFHGAEGARVPIGAPLVETYDEEIAVDILSGPSFKFERQKDRLQIHFLDWHRRWSHSVTLAVALAFGVAGLSALTEGVIGGGVTRLPLWASLVFELGFLGHVVEDQLGHMGSNLLFPFTRRRTRGLKLLHSGDGIPNFLTVWVGIMLILFNLDRFSVEPRLSPWWAFLGLAVVVPVVTLGGIYQRRRRRQVPQAAEALQQREILSEGNGTEIG